MTVYSWLHYAVPQPKDLEVYLHEFILKKGGFGFVDVQPIVHLQNEEPSNCAVKQEMDTDTHQIKQTYLCRYNWIKTVKIK